MQRPLLLVQVMLIAQQGQYVISPLLLPALPLVRGLALLLGLVQALLPLLAHVITPAVIMGNKLMALNVLPFLWPVVQTALVIPSAMELILFKVPLAIARVQRQVPTIPYSQALCTKAGPSSLSGKALVLVP